jgi:hypothetical protein
VIRDARESNEGVSSRELDPLGFVGLRRLRSWNMARYVFMTGIPTVLKSRNVVDKGDKRQ